MKVAVYAIYLFLFMTSKHRVCQCLTVSLTLWYLRLVLVSTALFNDVRLISHSFLLGVCLELDDLWIFDQDQSGLSQHCSHAIIIIKGKDPAAVFCSLFESQSRP